ncbi:MAG: hypothetical protein M3N98_01240 [Actinomycetota bacterium]|nr:hypothetical protein [Actinomycetota bacterium]
MTVRARAAIAFVVTLAVAIPAGPAAANAGALPPKSDSHTTRVRAEVPGALASVVQGDASTDVQAAILRPVGAAIAKPPPPPPPGPPPPTGIAAADCAIRTAADWLVIKVTAGPHGASHITGLVDYGGRLAGDGGVIGEGFAASGSPFRDVFAFSFGGARKSIATTRQAGGADFTVVPAGPGGTIKGGSNVTLDQLGPGGAAVILEFLPYGAVTECSVLAHVATGTIGISITTGTGSSLLRPADPADGGVAAEALVVAAGSATHSVTSPTGLVGAGMFECNCSESWASPDGRSGSFQETSTPSGGSAVGNFIFAGPPGPWSWTWSGEAGGGSSFGTPGEPHLAAWAPIGNDWTYFKG